MGLIGNAADVFPAVLAKGIIPDVVTDQTSAHDMLQRLRSARQHYAEALKLRKADPGRVSGSAFESAAAHVRAMLGFQKAGSVVFDYGNNLRAQAQQAGVTEAFDFPGFVPAYIRPQFCEGNGPFRWVALVGRSGRYRSHRPGHAGSLFPDDRAAPLD